MTFFSFWNTLEFSWIRNRLQVARAAKHYLISSDTTRCALLGGEQSALYRRASDFLRARGLLEKRSVAAIPFQATLRGVSHGSQTVGDAGDPPTSVLRRGGDTLSGTVSVDLTVLSLHRFVEELEATQLHSLVVLDIPALGVIFDVNDLGLMAGLAFVVILLMRKMSLNSEHAGIKTIFREAYRAGCARDAYEIVAMRQVLTVPIRPYEVELQSLRLILRWGYRLASMAINLAPCVVLLAVYRSNWDSAALGQIISPYNTQLSLSVTMVLLVATIGLSSLCLWTEIQIHRSLDTVIIRPEAEFLMAFFPEGAPQGPTPPPPPRPHDA